MKYENSEKKPAKGDAVFVEYPDGERAIGCVVYIDNYTCDVTVLRSVIKEDYECVGTVSDKRLTLIEG